MSKKLKAAILAQRVSVRGKTSGETQIWYRAREGTRGTVVLKPFATIEMAPKLTDAALLQWSNLEMLVKRGAIEII